MPLVESCLGFSFGCGYLHPGMPIVTDRAVLKKTCHIMVGTPGRLFSLLEGADNPLATHVCFFFEL
jgi:superfamily II DNA/RNA helicase